MLPFSRRCRHAPVHFSAPPSHRSAGWTLTELLIVMAIMGILAALAIPQYQQQQRQARRSDARAALQQVLLEQARYRGDHDSFATQLGDLGWSSERSPQGHYRLQILEASAEGVVTQATPVGPQAADTACSPMRLHWHHPATTLYTSGASMDSDPGRCWAP